MSLLSTCDFLLIVIVVAGGEKMSKDQRRHKHLLIFVFHHRNSLPIIPHGDGVGLSVDMKTHKIRSETVKVRAGLH